MKKFIVIPLAVLVVVYIGFAGFTYWQETQTPSVSKAPYYVQTNTRSYYAREVKGTSPNITLKGYYERDGSRWAYRTFPLTFNKNIPVLSVSDRRVAK